MSLEVKMAKEFGFIIPVNLALFSMKMSRSS